MCIGVGSVSSILLLVFIGEAQSIVHARVFSMNIDNGQVKNKITPPHKKIKFKLKNNKIILTGCHSTNE